MLQVIAFAALLTNVKLGLFLTELGAIPLSNILWGGKIKPFLAVSLFVSPSVSNFFPEIVQISAGDQQELLSEHRENLRRAWRRAARPSQPDYGLPLVLEVSLYMEEVTSALTSAS